MELGLSLLFLLSKPLREALRVLPRARELGVTVVELVDEGPHHLDGRRLRMVKKALSDHDLSVAIHAPFVDMNIGSPHEPTRRFMMKRHFRSMEMAHELEARAWVFHPGLLSGLSLFSPGVEWSCCLRSVRELYAKAEELGLDIFLENGTEPVPFLLKKVEDFKAFFSELEDLEVGLALDLGHAKLCGQVEAFIEAFPDRIGHVHIHDNDGRSDLHLGLGSSDTDWEAVVSRLKEVGYKGPLVVESVEGVWESLSFLKPLL